MQRAGGRRRRAGRLPPPVDAARQPATHGQRRSLLRDAGETRMLRQAKEQALDTRRQRHRNNAESGADRHCGGGRSQRPRGNNAPVHITPA